MTFETIKLDFQEQVAILKINRPQALNALNQQVLGEMDKALSTLDERADLRALIITGEGEKAFVAGADIKEMQDHSSEQAMKMAKAGQKLFQRIEDFKVPVIAAVNGFALGGGLELALSCDFIIASQKAKVGLPEVSLGLIPGYGGTQRLSRFLGKSLARMFVFTGDIYPANKAFEWGLFVEVVEPEQLLSTAMKYAKVIAQRSPVALRLAKQAINQGFDRQQAEGMGLEAQLFAKCFESQDKTEGIKAFIEKRSPKFLG